MEQEIHIEGKTFEIYLRDAEIQQRVEEIARQINSDYEGREPLFIGILNGAFLFTAALIQKINLPCKMAFMRLSSYEGTSSSGKVNTVLGLSQSIQGKDVIILEDIVDTGLTLVKLREMLEAEQPASVRICALLVKPEKHQVPVNVDYTGFVIPDKFVVGYGLDLNEYGRNLPHIYQLK